MSYTPGPWIAAKVGGVYACHTATNHEDERWSFAGYDAEIVRDDLQNDYLFGCSEAERKRVIAAFKEATGEGFADDEADDWADEISEWQVAQNARLIAAAPDLLEALKKIALMTNTPDSPPAPTSVWIDLHGIAKAAIAKAEGAK